MTKTKEGSNFCGGPPTLISTLSSRIQDNYELDAQIPCKKTYMKKNCTNWTFRCGFNTQCLRQVALVTLCVKVHSEYLVQNSSWCCVPDVHHTICTPWCHFLTIWWPIALQQVLLKIVLMASKNLHTPILQSPMSSREHNSQVLHMTHVLIRKVPTSQRQLHKVNQATNKETK